MTWETTPLPQDQTLAVQTQQIGPALVAPQDGQGEGKPGAFKYPLNKWEGMGGVNPCAGQRPGDLYYSENGGNGVMSGCMPGPGIVLNNGGVPTKQFVDWWLSDSDTLPEAQKPPKPASKWGIVRRHPVIFGLATGVAVGLTIALVERRGHCPGEYATGDPPCPPQIKDHK